MRRWVLAYPALKLRAESCARKVAMHRAEPDIDRRNMRSRIRDPSRPRAGPRSRSFHAGIRTLRRRRPRSKRGLCPGRFHAILRMMEPKIRLIAFVLAAVAAIAAGSPAAAQSWKEYSYPADAFTVSFPAEPKVESTVYQAANGQPAPARVYSVTNGSGVFKMTVVELANAALDETAVIGHAVKTLSESRPDQARYSPPHQPSVRPAAEHPGGGRQPLVDRVVLSQAASLPDRGQGAAARQQHVGRDPVPAIPGVRRSRLVRALQRNSNGMPFVGADPCARPLAADPRRGRASTRLAPTGSAFPSISKTLCSEGAGRARQPRSIPRSARAAATRALPNSAAARAPPTTARSRAGSRATGSPPGPRPRPCRTPPPPP